MLSFLKKKLIKHQKESLQELNLSQQYYGNTRRNTPAPDSIKKALSKINLRLVLIILTLPMHLPCLALELKALSSINLHMTLELS